MGYTCIPDMVEYTYDETKKKNSGWLEGVKAPPLFHAGSGCELPRHNTAGNPCTTF